jgi:hypothetical protein
MFDVIYGHLTSEFTRLFEWRCFSRRRLALVIASVTDDQMAQWLASQDDESRVWGLLLTPAKRAASQSRETSD